MNRKKLIPLLLFLLLLLLMVCVWCHSDDIIKNRAMKVAQANGIASTTVQKQDINFNFVKKENNLELTGTFSTDESVQVLHTATGDTKFNNLSTINKDLLAKEGVIELTQKLLLPFNETYKEGSISYANGTLTVEGIVDNEGDKDAIATLLASSTIDSQNNTRVVKPVPTAEELALIQAQKEAEEAKIQAEEEAKRAEEARVIAEQTPVIKEDIDFKFLKQDKNLELTGNFASDQSVQTLHTALEDTNFTNLSKINNELLAKEGVVELTQKLLIPFNDKYKSGSISYANGQLSIEGIVDNENDKNAIATLLAQSSIDYQDNTRVVKPEPTAEELALIQAKKDAEEAKAKLAEEAKIAEETKLAEEAKRNAFEKELKELMALEPINFKLNKATLTPKSLLTIEKVVKILKENPKMNVEIGGHTDSSGNSEKNLILSQKRVDSVKAKLIELQIDSSRLRAVGYGASNPLVSNDTKENRLINRRVEFKVIGE